MNGLVARLFGYRSMTYRLEFHERALDEWRSLDAAVRARLKEKLAERLENPRVQKDRLSQSKDRYKIKLKRPGIRLVYEVRNQEITVAVIAIGPRERSAAYRVAAKRTYFTKREK